MDETTRVKSRYTDEYLDLMLEWGTIADIPGLVEELRRLQAKLVELGAEEDTKWVK